MYLLPMTFPEPKSQGIQTPKIPGPRPDQGDPQQDSISLSLSGSPAWKGLAAGPAQVTACV